MARRSRNRGRVARPRQGSASPARVPEVPVDTIVITSEPMPDPQMDALPEKDQDRICRAGQQAMQQRRPNVRALEKLLGEFPDIPCLYNYLTSAYLKSGRFEDAWVLTEETCRRFPDYLFGVTGYIQLAVLRGRLDLARRKIAGRFHILTACPGRREFHISELTAFQTAMAAYFSAVGDLERVLAYLGPLVDLAAEDSDVEVRLPFRRAA